MSRRGNRDLSSSESGFSNYTAENNPEHNALTPVGAKLGLDRFT